MNKELRTLKELIERYLQTLNNEELCDDSADLIDFIETVRDDELIRRMEQAGDKQREMHRKPFPLASVMPLDIKTCVQSTQHTKPRKSQENGFSDTYNNQKGNDDNEL